MPIPKKDKAKLKQMKRLLRIPRTVDHLVFKTGLSQVSIYRYLKHLNAEHTIIKSSGRPVTFQIVGGRL